MSGLVFSGHQPNFAPYMGFFYKIFQSDVFVFDDDVQYTSNDWTNKNFLKISGKKCRVTIPINYTFGDKISSVRIHYDDRWIRKLLKSVEMSYGKAPYFEIGYQLLEKHLRGGYTFLSDMNLGIIRDIINGFGFQTKLLIASEAVPTSLTGNERNVFQCKSVGSSLYYSGIGGKAYNDEKLYREEGIELVYTDYEPVEYQQQGYGFIPDLSVLDYIFNCGYEIPSGWKKTER